MAKNVPQDYANHRRIVPLYHVVAFLILAANVFWTLWQAIRDFSAGTAMSFLLAVALVLVWLYARVFALAVQDRVIRLEMRLRLQQLLPDDLKPRIGGLSVRQLVGLRFAGDAELPGLTRRVLDEGIADREAIKKLVTDWQGDYLRA